MPLPPHLAVVQELFNEMTHPEVVKPKQRKPASCSACLDTGSTESGRACNWCSASEQEQP